MKLNLNDFFNNLREVFSNFRYLIFFLVTFGLFYLFFELITNHDLIKGNLGLAHFYINYILQLLIAIFFASFLTFFVYKYVKFSSFDSKNSATSFIGTFFGILVAGCPACSITIASYIGLASLISLFPYHGLELKILGLLMLIYANYSSIKDLNQCRLKFK